jgi:acyl carrier protein
MSESIERIKQIIEDLFNIDDTTLNADSSALTVPEWDSMGQLMLVLELEQQFNIHISPEESEKLTSIAAIAELVAGAN